MKITNQKLKEINERYKLFETYDKEIDLLNEAKEEKLKDIIKLLEETDFLKTIRNIEEVISAQFNIWTDYESPNWKELELLIHTKKSRNKFDSFYDWEKYELLIRNEVYKILDANPNLNDIIYIDIEHY